jgi:hypothetical protein
MSIDARARAAAKALRDSTARFKPSHPTPWSVGAPRRRAGAVTVVAVYLGIAACLFVFVASFWALRPPVEPPAIGPLREGALGWRTLAAGPEGYWPSGMFWTGRGALVVAGADASANQVKGAIYDPGADRWRSIAASGMEWRGGEAVVWTGKELIVWGGDSGARMTVAGGRYDPVADRWSRIAEAPLPAQGGLEAVWTGREMIVLTANGDAAAYDPAADTWRPLPDLPLPPRTRPAVVWTGEEVVVWGGCHPATTQCDDAATGADELSDGAAYSPTSDRWRRLAASPLAARDRPGAVWAGSEMIVWGGIVPDGVRGAYGAAYDPARDTWRVIAKAPIVERSNHIAVWTGRELVVWGGVGTSAGDAFLDDGAAYLPSADAWKALPQAPIERRDRHVAVWTGTELLIWGGCCDRAERTLHSGAALRLA